MMAPSFPALGFEHLDPQAMLLLAFLQRFLRAFAVADVLGQGDDFEGTALGIPSQGEALARTHTLVPSFGYNAVPRRRP